MWRKARCAADAAPALAETMRKYNPADATGILKLYNGAKAAVCGCALRNINTTTSLAVYVLVIKACEYLKG